jgi:hypothetical protein
MKRVLEFALCSVLSVSSSVISGAAADPEYTLGDFAVAMATTMRLAVPQDGFNSETATAALREAGIVLKGDSRSALTEADVVSALGQLGLKLTTGNPGRSVPESRAVQILKVLDGAVAAGAESSDRGGQLPTGGPEGSEVPSSSSPDGNR